MNTRHAGAEQSASAVFLFTADPFVVIEEQREGYVRYRNIESGRRWEIYGTCVKLGHCLVGATIDGEYIDSLERAQELAKAYTGLDNPVTPEFKGCCPLVGRWLEDGI